MTENPYATSIPEPAQPAPPPVPVPNQGFLGREGNQLVMQQQTQLPPFCVKTNEPALHWVERKLSWHHPALALTILAGVLVYAILAIILTKKMTVHIPLSEEAFRKRSKRLLILRLTMVVSLLAFLGGIVLAAVSDRNQALMGTGLLLLFGGILIGLIAAVIHQGVSNIIKPKKITDLHGWYAGVDNGFLERLEPVVKPH